MTVKYYYESLPKRDLPSFREKVMEECGMSYGTFYRKLRNDTFSPLEREKIESITGSEIIVKTSKQEQQ